MDLLIEKLVAAPAGSVLILAGIAFLLIAVGVKLSGKVEPGPRGQIASGVIGVSLLIVGLLLTLRPSPPLSLPNHPFPPPPALASCSSYVSGLFSDQREQRRSAQVSLLSQCASDPATVSFVIDTAHRNMQNSYGVYDALSFLDKVPENEIRDPTLRRKIYDFATEAVNATADSPPVSARLKGRFGK